MNRLAIASFIVCAGLATCAPAQVVINEVLQNPPGDASASDAFAEYIELYGPPGFDLTGYAVACFKGGSDADGNDVPENPAEIDEAFSLDGLSIGTNGFLVLYNGTAANSFIPLFLAPGSNSASFITKHIPTTDTAGNLSNDDSSTYLLVRRRAATTGGFPTAFRKDINPDVDFDGRIDFGIETPLATQGGQSQPAASRIDPLQIIDEFAWSDNGGKEYVRDSEQEISTTDGFNPDGVSRLAYYGENPGLGLRLDSMSMVVPTRTADEEFIYGETDVVGGGFFEYNGTGGAPTDPEGDGFDDIATAGFDLTPGGFNDHAGLGIAQFRFTLGDLNFDGVVTNADASLMAMLVGADFDATEDFIDPDSGLPIADPANPGSNFQSYIYQGRLANAFLAARELDTNDGAGGSNAPSPTEDDAAALGALFCPADIDGNGTLNLDDIDAFVAAFLGGGLGGDCDANGTLNVDDIDCFVSSFLGGCA